MLFLKFAMIGAIGFLIDATMFFLSIHLLGSGWAQARAIAFLSAVTVTWLGNRRYTFGSRAQWHGESLRYLCVQSGGCLVNYLSFVNCVSLFGTDRWLVTPYLVGTGAGLMFNYTLSRYFVFQTR